MSSTRAASPTRTANRASIGFALLARDAGDHLEACLKSIRPYCQQIVCGVDRLSKDKTERIARRHADVVFPVDVSEWHECEQHGRVQAQHFARARNETFKRLDPKLDFHAWIDADDVIPNARLLPAIAKNLPDDAIGVWSPYEYSAIQKEDGTRQVNTLFHRERLLRTRYRGQPVTWEWQHRVHEVVVPVGVVNPQWIQNDELRWVHQHQAHKSEHSAPRNLLLLEIELEENPDDPRTVFYMGNQYFAMGEWDLAAEWYDNYCQRFPDGNPHERWQAYCYASLAYERLGSVSDSLRTAFGAIDALPYHPEPYWRLACIYTLLEQPEKAIYWTEQADQRQDAPFFAFKNPMDRQFNKLLPLADSYMQLGNVSAAKRVWQQAVSVFPDERVLASLDKATAQEQGAKIASDYVSMASLLDDEGKLALYDKLPEGVKSFGRTRNVAMTALRKRRKALTQPKIVFWCNRSLEPWAPPTLTTTGIGGSETAVIKIAERFSRAGWLVDVYNGADYMEGEYDGVGYWDPERLGSGETCDVFVSWRQPSAHSMPVEARQKVLWCHDLNYGPGAADDFPKWDRALGVSHWHEQMLERYYPFSVRDLAPEYGFVPNGVDLERFPDAKKVPWRCVYASSPDRGLGKVLELWPRILKAEPEAELHLAYGWENIDRMIASGRSDLVPFREQMTRMIEQTERVVWRGRLPQDELATLYAESWLWLYPADFLEVSCISAMEAMAGGAIPVAVKAGALPETIGDAGLLVPGPIQSRAFNDVFPKVASGAMMDEGMRREYERRGRERALGFTWDAALDRWLAVLGLDVAQEKAA